MYKRQAGGESERALRILRLLLEAGAEEEEAIRLLNSMLLLSGDGEHFSTIDLVVMNLYTGSVHIAKAGSAATILKKQGRMQVYRSDNVPVGIMEKAEWEAFQDHVAEDVYKRQGYERTGGAAARTSSDSDLRDGGR